MIKYIKFARLDHWLKGIVIFLPIIFSGKIIEYNLFIILIKTFYLFGIVSSLSYCINDLVDNKIDKNHKIKKYKPIASGIIKIKSAIIFCIFLLILIITSFFLNNIDPKIKFSIITYFFISLIYTLYLKKIIFFEVFLVSSLYQLRLIAGCFSIDVMPSFLMSTQIYFITTLIFFCKRYSDIFLYNKNNDNVSPYYKKDQKLIKLIYTFFFLSIFNYFYYSFISANINIFQIIKILLLMSLVIIGLYEFINKSIKFHMASDPVKLIINSIIIQTTFILWIFVEIINIYIIKW